MNENKRLLMIFGIVIAVVLVIVLISFWPKADKEFACGIKADGDYDKLGKVNYKQYQCLMKEEKKNSVIVAKDLSDKEKENLNNAATSIGHVLYYLDTEAIGTDDMKTAKKELQYADNSFGKDVIVIIENGKVQAHKEDILGDKEAINTFLKEAKLAKFACDIASSSEYEGLGEITYDQYKCLYESDEPFALVLAQTTCSYCVKFKPIINDYAVKNNLPVYVIEIDKLTNDERTALLASLEYFKDNDEWGTPLTLGIKNKAVVTEIGGYTDKTETLDEFFQKMEMK